MLRWRLLLGPILAAAVVAVFRADVAFGPSAPILLGFAILVAARGSYELVQLLRERQFPPNAGLVFLGSGLTVAANWWPWEAVVGASLHPLTRAAPALVVLVLCGMLLFAVRAFQFRAPGGNIERLALEWLCIFYLGGLLSLTAQLRWVRIELGYLPMVSAIAVAKISDTLAFTFGKLLGGPKLVPLLSPGKTWSGAIGGILGGMASGVGVLFLIAPWFAANAVVRVDRALLFGFVVGLAGLVGDLCESLIKRDVGQKDSAPMLPGFGGLLDLLDSVAFAGPVAWILWVLAPPVT